MASKKKPASARHARSPPQKAAGVWWLAAASACVLAVGLGAAFATSGVAKSSTTERTPPLQRPPKIERKDPGCVDNAETCATWADAGECEKNPTFMNRECRYSCNGCSEDDAAAAAPKRDPGCADKSPDCGLWAQRGECEANPGYMLVSCASSCDKCDMLDYRKRCAVDETVPLSVPPGAIGETFKRAASSDLFAGLEPTLLSSEPPVLQFDRFVSDEEADAFISRAQTKGWVESEDAGAMRADGSFEAIRSSHRNSLTAWCDNADCQGNEHIQRVMQRAEEVTRVPQNNSEFVQVLQYGVGQYYGGHHDYIPAHARLPCGPRVYTLFMYLSDVEEGGETEFAKLGIKATPKKGRALLWPSTFDDRPLVQDHRTFHEAKPVIRGLKHAANLWIHQHDFKKAHRLGCSG